MAPRWRFGAHPRRTAQIYVGGDAHTRTARRVEPLGLALLRLGDMLRMHRATGLSRRRAQKCACVSRGGSGSIARGQLQSRSASAAQRCRCGQAHRRGRCAAPPHTPGQHTGGRAARKRPAAPGAPTPHGRSVGVGGRAAAGQARLCPPFAGRLLPPRGGEVAWLQARRAVDSIAHPRLRKQCVRAGHAHAARGSACGYEAPDLHAPSSRQRHATQVG